MQTFPKQNVGTTLMILQEQYNHNKKLDAIYRRTITFPTHIQQKDNNLSVRKKDLKKETINSYQREQHLKNIKKLLEVITRQKTIYQRMKDQNDFFVYPALFFREKIVVNSEKKKKRSKNGKKQTSTSQQQSENNLVSSLSVDKIKHNLPVLTHYDQYDWEEWTDAVNKMVIGYNIMNRDQLLSFAVKVLSVLPKNCPIEFKQAAQKWLDDICTDKVEVW